MDVGFFFLGGVPNKGDPGPYDKVRTAHPIAT